MLFHDEVVDPEELEELRVEGSEIAMRSTTLGASSSLSVLVEMGAELCGSVSGIAEHLDRAGLAGDQSGRCLSVAGVARGELAGGDDSGVGLDRNMGFTDKPADPADLHEVLDRVDRLGDLFAA